MSWTHAEDTRPKARKEHQCGLCGYSIEAGEVYIRRSGFGDDGLFSFAMHSYCEALTHDWTDSDWESISTDDFSGFSQTDYQHEIDVDGHRALAAGLAAIDGMAIVSGYPSELYDELYAGWRQMRRSARCHNGAEATEVLWISPNADRHMRQGRLFS